MERKEVTELTFQLNAKLMVPKEHLPEMHAWVRQRVRDFYAQGSSQSEAANYLVRAIGEQGHTGEPAIQALTNYFLSRVVGF